MLNKLVGAWYIARTGGEVLTIRNEEPTIVENGQAAVGSVGIRRSLVPSVTGFAEQIFRIVLCTCLAFIFWVPNWA